MGQKYENGQISPKFLTSFALFFTHAFTSFPVKSKVIRFFFFFFFIPKEVVLFRFLYHCRVTCLKIMMICDNYTLRDTFFFFFFLSLIFFFNYGVLVLQRDTFENDVPKVLSFSSLLNLFLVIIGQDDTSLQNQNFHKVALNYSSTSSTQTGRLLAIT